MHGPNYGELVEWDEDAAHRLDIIGFPRGQLILDAQATLLCILCNIVERLTEGLEETQKLADGNRSSIEIPKPQEKRSGHTELWSRYLNQTFSDPPKFDIDFIISTSTTKVNSLNDHLWLM